MDTVNKVVDKMQPELCEVERNLMDTTTTTLQANRLETFIEKKFEQVEIRIDAQLVAQPGSAASSSGRSAFGRQVYHAVKQRARAKHAAVKAQAKAKAKAKDRAMAKKAKAADTKFEELIGGEP